MSATLAPKDPDSAQEYAIDARVHVVPPARRKWPYDSLDVVRGSQMHTGFYYVCTQAGETGHKHPVWPRADGETVADGSVIWTCRAPASAGLPAISTVVWDGGGLTVDSQRIDDGVAYVTLSGGVAGTSYEVTARITWNNGHADDYTITIPVSEQ